ncbi:hypothetical protein AS159_05170 [Thermotoga sp. Ku-13t]|uniref:hypothetical protein n=1 Tax=Thermotoga sp. Ku-13t TaxID=1755813 RepID=UPI0016B99AD8|nr:hypothetical protein [Thermotoga sp. Ku-13t]KAF2957798.1 hypothetical protein AS159_05170 [Thermotoga sp. Ku-13t]
MRIVSRAFAHAQQNADLFRLGRFEQIHPATMTLVRQPYGLGHFLVWVDDLLSEEVGLQFVQGFVWLENFEHETSLLFFVLIGSFLGAIF